MSDIFKRDISNDNKVASKRDSKTSQTASFRNFQSNGRISREVFRSIKLEFPYYTYSNFQSFRLAYEEGDFKSMFKILDKNPHVSVIVIKSNNEFNSNDLFFNLLIKSALNLAAIDAVKRGWWVELKEILSYRPIVALTSNLKQMVQERKDDEDTRTMEYLINEAIYENLRRSVVLDDVSLFDYAVNFGADLDSVKGREILSLAARLDRVNFLVRAHWMGIDLTKKDNMGWTPMDWALNAGSINSIKFLSTLLS